MYTKVEGNYLNIKLGMIVISVGMHNKIPRIEAAWAGKWISPSQWNSTWLPEPPTLYQPIQFGKTAIVFIIKILEQLLSIDPSSSYIYICAVHMSWLSIIIMFSISICSVSQLSSPFTTRKTSNNCLIYHIVIDLFMIGLFYLLSRLAPCTCKVLSC